MSDSYECDRCGTYYDEKNRLERNPTTFSLPANINDDVWDLCEDCFAEFEEFMAGDKPSIGLESDPYDLLDRVDEWAPPRYLREIKMENNSNVVELHFSEVKSPNRPSDMGMRTDDAIQLMWDTLTDVHGPPTHPMECGCTDTIDRINKNVFGDADRAEDALDDQIERGHRNY